MLANPESILLEWIDPREYLLNSHVDYGKKAKTCREEQNRNSKSMPEPLSLIIYEENHRDEAHELLDIPGMKGIDF